MCGIAVFVNLSVSDGHSDVCRGVDNSHKGRKEIMEGKGSAKTCKTDT